MQMQSQVSARFREPQFEALREEERATTSMTANEQGMTPVDETSPDLKPDQILVKDVLATDEPALRQAACEAAVKALQEPTLSIFNADDGRLIRLDRLPLDAHEQQHAAPLHNPKDTVHVSTMTPARIGALLWRRMSCVERKRTKTGKLQIKKCGAPAELVTSLLEKDLRPYPVLEGIATCPQIDLQTGIARLEEGYEENTKLFFDFAGFTFLDAPETPTEEDVKDASNVLLDLISEFQFSPLPDGLPDPSEPEYEEAVELSRRISKSVAFSLILTSACFMNASHPLFFCASSNPGSGKSTLGDLIAAIITGLPSAVTYSWPKSTEEQDKQLMMISLQKYSFVCFDNLEGTINAAKLAIMATQGTLSGRQFGKINEALTAKVHTLFYMNGNNCKITMDLVRRTMQMCLNAMGERATDKKYKRENLIEFTLQNRAKIWKCILTIMRYTIQNIAELEKKYSDKLRHFNSFSKWSKIIRPACLLCGMEDPVLSQNSLYAGDPDRQALTLVIRGWRDIFPDQELSLVDIFKATAAARGGDPNKKTAAENFLEILEAAIPQTREGLTARSVGMWFRAHVRQSIDGWMIETGSRSKTGRRWTLLRTTPEPTPATTPTKPTADEPDAPSSTPAPIVPTSNDNTTGISWAPWNARTDAYYA